MNNEKNNKNENISDKEQREQSIIIPLNKKVLKGVLIVIAFTFVLYLCATNADKLMEGGQKLLTLFSPFIIGLCLSFVMNTLLVPLEKLWDKLFRKSKSKLKDKLRRPVCLILSTLAIFGIVFAVIFMLIPELINTVSNLIKMMPGFIGNLDNWWAQLKDLLAEHNIVLPDLDFDFSKILDTVNTFISNYGEKFIHTTVNFTTSIITFIVNIILAVVFSIYILAQKETLGRQFRNALFALFPERKTNKLLDLLSLSNQSFSKFIAGQLLEAVIIGVLCFIGMLIFRMPYAGVVSVLVGFTALIPVFGAFIGTGVGAFLILLENPMKALWFVVFIIVLQQIEGNLIYPKVVGKSVGLPGIWVLVAVTIGGGAFGIPGMLFGVPICSILYVLTKEFINKRKENAEKDKQPEVIIE